MKHKYVFFDLDGTLTDPGLGITNSVIYALDKFGIKVNDRKELYKFIGPPLLDSFRDFYGFDEETSRLAMKYYREYFGEKGIFENQVYEGIPKVLSQLKSRGHRLMVATSKPTPYTLRILDKFNLSQYFEFVSGSAMDEKNSSKTQIIKFAIDSNKLASEDIIMIGDRKHDIIGAKANNVHCAGVLYGYGDLFELQDAGADDIIETVDSIVKHIS